MIEELESIPVDVLRDRSVSPLEAISEYLKDRRNLTYHQIAVLVNRNDRTIWTSYNRAKKKRTTPAEAPAEEPHEVTEQIPVEILKNRKLAPLEAISVFLKETRNMTFHQIAELVNRDDRTIWTCYHRAKKKGTHE